MRKMDYSLIDRANHTVIIQGGNRKISDRGIMCVLVIGDYANTDEADYNSQVITFDSSAIWS